MGILPILILMLGVIGMISFLAQKVAIPAPVLLAASGVAWSLIPSLPSLEIAPAVILSVFLPPLLYADAWQASWIDFRRWLRPILQLAIGLVAFTILTVGLIAHWALPGLPWAACFLLGAIVSPTDTVAVHAVLERLRVPCRRLRRPGGDHRRLRRVVAAALHRAGKPRRAVLLLGAARVSAQRADVSVRRAGDAGASEAGDRVGAGNRRSDPPDQRDGDPE